MHAVRAPRRKAWPTPRCGCTATRVMGGMKGAPGLVGHVPLGRGGRWSTRPRLPPLTRPALPLRSARPRLPPLTHPALPVGQPDRRRTRRHAVRGAGRRHLACEAPAAGQAGRRRSESPRRIWSRAASPVQLGGRPGRAARARVCLMSVGAVRRARLYPPIQPCSAIVRQGPPARLTNRGGIRELGFLPGLLGIAHGIAHEVAHGIAETHGTTGPARIRGSRLPRLAPGGLEVLTRIVGSSS